MMIMVKFPFRFSHRYSPFFIVVAFSLLYSMWMLAGVLAPVAHAESPPLKIEQKATVEYAESGPRITYETTVINEGTTPLTGVLITDVLPAQANLLYFSGSEGGNWLSTEKTEAGRVAIWINQEPLEPGGMAQLTYVVEVPWQNVESADLDKDLPVAHADGWDETASQEIIGVTLDQTLAPTATPSMTPTPEPSPTSTPTVGITDTPTTTASPTTPVEPTEPVSATAQPETTLTPPPTSPPAITPVEDNGTSATIVIVIAVVIAIILLIAVWLVLKKR